MGGIFRQYSWIVDLVAILFCSYFLASITGIYVGRSLEVKRSIGVLKTADVEGAREKREDVAGYQIIVERNIFDATDRSPEAVGEAVDEMVEEAPDLTGEAVETSLSITVLGVLVVGDGRDSRSSATISSGSQASAARTRGRRGRSRGRSASSAKVYSVGDEESFAPNTKLVMVAPDRIEFTNSGRLEYAEVAGTMGADIFGPPTLETVASVSEGAPQEKDDSLIRKEAPGKFTVDRAEVDNALQNLDRLYTDIRAVPNFSGGKVSGMKILSVKGGSIFAKLGLKRGDVLQRINGMELDVKRGFEIFNKLKDENNITLDVIRQGQPTTLEYDIR